MMLNLSRLVAHVLVAVGCMAADSPSCLIQSKQVGSLRVGMTVRVARQVLRGVVFELAEDADHMTMQTVTRGGAKIMDLYLDADETNLEKARIALIRVYDPQCATVKGIHPGSLLLEIEKQYGQLIRLERTEVESREYAEFEKVPSWLSIQSGNGEAGVYLKKKRCAESFVTNAKANSLWVSGERTSTRFFLNDAECNVAEEAVVKNQ